MWEEGEFFFLTDNSRNSKVVHVTVQVLQEADAEMDMEVLRNLLGVEGDFGRERREGLRS